MTARGNYSRIEVVEATLPFGAVMNCQNLNELYSEYLDGATTDDQRAAFEAHIADCATCATDFACFHRIVAQARALEPLPAPTALRRNVRQALQPRESWWRQFVGWWRRPVYQRAIAGAMACGLVLIIVKQNKSLPIRETELPPPALTSKAVRPEPSPPSVGEGGRSESPAKLAKSATTAARENPRMITTPVLPARIVERREPPARREGADELKRRALGLEGELADAKPTVLAATPALATAPPIGGFAGGIAPPPGPSRPPPQENLAKLDDDKRQEPTGARVGETFAFGRAPRPARDLAASAAISNAGASTEQARDQAEPRSQAVPQLGRIAAGREVILLALEPERFNQSESQLRMKALAPAQAQKSGDSDAYFRSGKTISVISVVASVRGAVEVGEALVFIAEVRSPTRLLEATIQLEGTPNLEFLAAGSSATGVVTIWGGTLLAQEATRTIINLRPLAPGAHTVTVLLRAGDDGRVLARRSFALSVGVAAPTATAAKARK